MTKALIHKIKKVGNYRIFQNWQPDGGVEFARVNLIYGQNGSGRKRTEDTLSFKGISYNSLIRCKRI